MNYKKIAKLLNDDIPKSQLEEVCLQARALGYKRCINDFLNLENEGLNLDTIHARLLVKYDALSEAFKQK